MREHGASKYKKEGCRCDVCKAGQARRVATQRARRRAGIAPATSTPDVNRATRVRRFPGAIQASEPQTESMRAHRERVAPEVAPVSAVPASTTGPVGQELDQGSDPGMWSPGLWETELQPLLTMPAIRSDGYVGMVTLNPPYDYTEFVYLLESCRESFDDFPLEWEYVPGTGVYIWRTDIESAPIPVTNTPVSKTSVPIGPVAARKVTVVKQQDKAKPRIVSARVIAPSVPSTSVKCADTRYSQPNPTENQSPFPSWG